MNNRIKQLMDNQHMNQQLFAEYLGISSATLSGIFTGRTKVTLNTIKAIKSKFPTLNYSWLIDGTGPMFNDDKYGTSSSNQSHQSSTSNFASTNYNIKQHTPSSSEASSPHLSSKESFLDFDGPSVSNKASSQSSKLSAQDKENPSFDSSRLTNGAPKIINKIIHNVSQILIIYDDQTCETFIPKK